MIIKLRIPHQFHKEILITYLKKELNQFNSQPTGTLIMKNNVYIAKKTSEHEWEINAIEPNKTIILLNNVSDITKLSWDLSSIVNEYINDLFLINTNGIHLT